MTDDVPGRTKLETEASCQRARRNHVRLQALNAAASLQALFPADAHDSAYIPVGKGGERLTAARVRRWVEILGRIEP